MIIVPDQTDLDRLSEACAQVLGATGFAVLVAEAGPAARYRAFLSALRGEVRVVIGNRAAAYAPVRDLGLVALWDDGDDLLAEQRAPYPHARDVLALRADGAQAGLCLPATPEQPSCKLGSNAAGCTSWRRIGPAYGMALPG